MSSKSILVIGAAESCLGMVRSIKAMGHRALVVSSDNKQPCIQHADAWLIAEDGDVPAVVEFCHKHHADAIVPTPVDRTLLWQAQVAEALGLIFLPAKVIDNFRHKFTMKQTLEVAKVPCAKGVHVKGTSWREQFGNMAFPVVCKPIDGYASRGVVKCDNELDLDKYFYEASSFSADASVVIEEFIEGREFNAEGVCFQGKVEIYAIVEKNSDPFPRTIEMGHIIPADISKHEEQLIVKTVEEAVLALGMRNGAFNTEIKIDKGKAWIIEVNGRLAGDFIVSHLIKPCTGQDMERAVINIALGIAPETAKRKYPMHGVIMFFNLPAGRIIESIGNLEELSRQENLLWIKSFFKPGDTIPEVQHMGNRSGFVILLAPNRKLMMEHLDRVMPKVLSQFSYREN